MNSTFNDNFYNALKAEEKTAEVPCCGGTLTVRRRLELADMMNFIRIITDSVFTDNGVYTPEAEDFARRCAILDFYADISIPEDMEERFDAVYSDVANEVIDAIMDTVDMVQYSAICDAIRNKIDYRIHADISDVDRKAGQVLDAIEKVNDTMAGLFSKVTDEEIAGLIEALIRGFDEEKIVRALIAAKKEEEEAKPGEE